MQNGIVVSLLVIVLGLQPVVAPDNPPAPPAPQERCNINRSCIAQLSRDVQDFSGRGLMSNFTGFTSSVLHCAGYEGTPLRPIRLLLPAGGEGMAPILDGLSKSLTGFRVEYEIESYDELGNIMFNTTGTPRQFDGWVSDPRWLADHSRAGLLQPLDNYIAGDSAMEWLDVERFFRTSSCVYNGQIVGMPINGLMPNLYYRTDVLAAANLTIPRTWEDMLEVARILNGTDFDGDGIGDYAMCQQMKLVCSERDWFLNQILVTMIQTQGTSSGWMFDLNTMRPAVDTPAFALALNILRQFIPYVYPQQQCEDAGNSRWLAGRCAILANTDLEFKALTLQISARKWRPKVSIAQLPGSPIVYDRSTGQMVHCTKALCPYATMETLLDGSQMLVNTATNAGFVSYSGYVNAYSDPEYQKATYQVLAALSSYTTSMQLIYVTVPIGPFRTKHLSITNASLAKWVAYGYSRDLTLQYLTGIKTTLEHPNIVVAVRTLGCPKFRAVLQKAVGEVFEGVSTSDIQADVVNKFNEIMGTFPIAEFADTYYKGLNLPNRYVTPMQPAPPAPPLFGPSVPPTGPHENGQAPNASSSNINQGTIMGLGFGLGVPVLAFMVFWMSGAGRYMTLGYRVAPGLGIDTTLLVTGVANAPMLWSTVDQAAMDRSMELYHQLVTRLLKARCHLGYESSREGDTCVVAFHTPHNAVAFAQALQDGLLHLEWPPALLESHLAKPVWAKALVIPSGPQGLRMASSVATAATADSKINLGHSSDELLHPSDNGVAMDTQSMPDICAKKDTEAEHVQQSLLSPQWVECDPPAQVQAGLFTRLIFRGLRVRCGLHSGMHDPDDLVLDPETKRSQYMGRPLKTAKAVAQCAHGGQVAMSLECFERLPIHQLGSFGMCIHMGDVFLTDDHELPPTALYQVVSEALQARLCFLDIKPSHGHLLQVGALGAPTGNSAIAFARLVGVQTLLAWNREQAEHAIVLYQQLAMTLLMHIPDLPEADEDRLECGYVAELASGLCLASFRSPLSAVLWALHLVSELLHVDWDEELLQHELCEKVTLCRGNAKHAKLSTMKGPPVRCGSGSFQRQATILPEPDFDTLARPAVLFRGPRLKVGIDMGSVHASINPVTGRVTYRGRVMNRAARIADRTGSGQVWCTEQAWTECQASGSSLVTGDHLGVFTFKVSQSIPVIQHIPT